MSSIGTSVQVQAATKPAAPTQQDDSPPDWENILKAEILLKKLTKDVGEEPPVEEDAIRRCFRPSSDTVITGEEKRRVLLNVSIFPTWRKVALRILAE